MRRLLSILIMLSLVAVAWLPVSRADAQSQTPDVEMGYSPTSLVMIAAGVPVYTSGDELWVMSEYNQTINVDIVAPGGTVVAHQALLPYSPARLCVFNDSDSPGMWILGVVTPSRSSFATYFSLQTVPALPSPVLTGASILPNGSLLMSFRADLNNAYNAQGCIVGSGSIAAVTVPFVNSTGGSVLLTLKSGAVSVDSVPTGALTIASAFDFWVELYYPYSYSSPQSTRQLVTSDVLAAKTETLNLPSAARLNITVALDLFTHLRTGRYDLRAFFRGPRGLSVHETTVLVYGPQKWLWLGGCVDTVSLSPSFSVLSQLSAPQNTWPTGIYFMADSNGVEGSGYSALTLNISRITLAVSPWGGPLPSSISVSVQPNPGISGYQVYNSTVFADLGVVPTQVAISLGYAGTVLENATVPVGSRLSASAVKVSLGMLVVGVSSNNVAVAHAAVSLSSIAVVGAVVDSRNTGQTGAATFLVFPGNYTVRLRYGSVSQWAQVEVISGKSAILNFVVPQTSNPIPMYLLLAVGVVGVLLNLWVWRGTLRRKT